MTKYEAAKLKEMAMGMEMGKRVLILKALDTIENKRIEVNGLLSMLEKANQQIDRMQMRADAAWETNRTLMRSVDILGDERDAALKRVQELEAQYESLG